MMIEDLCLEVGVWHGIELVLEDYVVSVFCCYVVWNIGFKGGVLGGLWGVLGVFVFLLLWWFVFGCCGICVWVFVCCLFFGLFLWVWVRGWIRGLVCEGFCCVFVDIFSNW